MGLIQMKSPDRIDVFLVAAEPSGDQLGREVVDYLKSISSEYKFAGIGGRSMQEIGIKSAIDTTPLSVVGLFEGFKVWTKAIKLANQAVDEILTVDPKVVVLIDSWGFSLRIAQRLRKRAPEIPIIKLIGPQVWATRSGRAKTLAATVDHLLCIYDLETPYYKKHGLKTTVIGVPALARTLKGDGKKFRTDNGIRDDRKFLLVLPGSRSSEMDMVAPVLVDAAQRIKNAVPDLIVKSVPASTVREDYEKKFNTGKTEGSFPIIDEQDKSDAIAAADLTLVCSGTASTEVAIQETPMIVAYRSGWLTWVLARGLLYQRHHVTLLNIVSDDQEIIPEFIQTRLRAGLIAKSGISMLNNPDRLKEAVILQNQALKRMKAGERPPHHIAGDAILEYL